MKLAATYAFFYALPTLYHVPTDKKVWKNRDVHVQMTVHTYSDDAHAHMHACAGYVKPWIACTHRQGQVYTLSPFPSEKLMTGTFSSRATSTFSSAPETDCQHTDAFNILIRLLGCTCVFVRLVPHTVATLCDVFIHRFAGRNEDKRAWFLVLDRAPYLAWEEWPRCRKACSCVCGSPGYFLCFFRKFFQFVRTRCKNQAWFETAKRRSVVLSRFIAIECRFTGMVFCNIPCLLGWKWPCCKYTQPSSIWYRGNKLRSRDPAHSWQDDWHSAVWKWNHKAVKGNVYIRDGI